MWGKGSKQRRVPLSAAAVQAVAAWLAEGRAALVGPDSPDDAIFLDEHCADRLCLRGWGRTWIGEFYRRAAASNCAKEKGKKGEPSETGKVALKGKKKAISTVESHVC